MKTCVQCCTSKPLDCFYNQRNAKSGKTGKCKECIKENVRKYRKENIDKIRAYDRKRGNRQNKSYLSEYRSKYPNKYKAHNVVNNAIRDKKLFRQACEVCGTAEADAHHDDYLKPLNIRWLCSAHHHQWHAKNGEAKNPK